MVVLQTFKWMHNRYVMILLRYQSIQIERLYAEQLQANEQMGLHMDRYLKAQWLCSFHVTWSILRFTNYYEDGGHFAAMYTPNIYMISSI
ncbi:hypothetical protein DOY81_015134, partial [Sarcophaga bullata]